MPSRLFLTAFAFAGALAASPVPAAHPFYVNLMSEGSLAHQRGDHRTAANKLRIACFGFLDEPDLLTECSVRLAVAQAASGDREAFDEAFHRVVELERRFATYEASRLPVEIRDAFEQQVLAWAPVDSLAGMNGFRSLYRRQIEGRLAGLPVDQRRRELTALASTEPDEPEWLLQLARIEVEQRNPALAREWTRQVLELRPDSEEARCLSARAAAQAGACAEAVEGLAACADGPQTVRSIEDEVGCFVALGRLDAAAARFASAPEELREQRPMRRLGQRLEEARRAGERAAAIDPPAEPAAASPTARLAAIRAAIDAGDDLEVLRTVAADAAALADESPEWTEAQQAAGEAAYRVARWNDAVRFLDRAEIDPAEQPALLFYLAVARFETGNREGAAEALTLVLPRLRRTPLVDRYAERILADS